MQGDGDGGVLGAAGVQDGGAEEGEGVVHVDDVGFGAGEGGAQVAVGFLAPDDPAGQGGLLGHGPVLDRVAVPFEPDDLVAAVGQRFPLVVDDPVLPARRRGPVPVMHHQNPHTGLR